MELQLKPELPTIELEKLKSYMAVELFNLFQKVVWTPNMSFYLPWISRDMKTITEISKFIGNNQIIEDNDEKYTRAILYDNKIAGIISYTLDSDNPNEANIGYFLGPEFVKKGIAASALKTLTKAILQQNLQPVLYIYPLNQDSIKVAQKIGYSLACEIQKYNKTMLKYTLDKLTLKDLT